MTELSDYKRIVEAPAVRAYEATIATQRIEIARLTARLAEAEKVIGPFAEAADDLEAGMLDRSEIWECPAAMNINAGNIRAARDFLKEDRNAGTR